MFERIEHLGDMIKQAGVPLLGNASGKTGGSLARLSNGSSMQKLKPIVNNHSEKVESAKPAFTHKMLTNSPYNQK